MNAAWAPADIRILGVLSGQSPGIGKIPADATSAGIVVPDQLEGSGVVVVVKPSSLFAASA